MSRRGKTIFRGYIQGRRFFGKSPVHVLGDGYFEYEDAYYHVDDFPLKGRIHMEGTVVEPCGYVNSQAGGYRRDETTTQEEAESICLYGAVLYSNLERCHDAREAFQVIEDPGSTTTG